MDRSYAWLTERLSASSIDLLLRCEAAFMFRYIEGVRKPPDGSMAAGRAFDTTANGFYLDRMAFDSVMSDDDVRDFFAAQFDREAQQVETWHEDRGTLLDRGVGVSSVWRERVGVFVMPKRMQSKLTVQVQDVPERDELNASLGLARDFELRGYLDLIGDVPKLGETIIDHKLSARAWSTKDVLRSTQAAVYTKATGIEHFQFHVGRRDLQKPTVQVLTRRVGQSSLRGLVSLASAARRKIALSIKTGDFMPNRSNYLCSRRWCAYWDRCEKRFGGRVPQ